MLIDNLVTLGTLGFNEEWSAIFARRGGADERPMRVSAAYKGEFEVTDGAREGLATLSGKLRFASFEPSDMPVVGDWVAVSEAYGTYQITGVLPRASLLRRIDGYHGQMQPMAANVDYALLVQSLNNDLNVNRLQRYASVAYEAGVAMIIVLTKADIAENTGKQADGICAAVPGVPVVITSAYTRTGLEELAALMPAGRTVIALGSSGVGKSSLLNALAERELMPVGEIRYDDDKGRHTTRVRKLHALPWGALFIDTPGMREIAGGESGGMFADIEGLAAQCAFRDCKHEREPGCAIREALDTGTLMRNRYRNYLALRGDEQRVDRLQRVAERRTERILNEKRGVHYKDARRGRFARYDE